MNNNGSPLPINTKSKKIGSLKEKKYFSLRFREKINNVLCDSTIILKNDSRYYKSNSQYIFGLYGFYIEYNLNEDVFILKYNSNNLASIILTDSPI